MDPPVAVASIVADKTNLKLSPSSTYTVIFFIAFIMFVQLLLLLRCCCVVAKETTAWP